MSVDYNPRDSGVIANPYPIFRELQDSDPAHWSETLGGWVLTRYADVRLALTDKRFSADRLRPYFAHQPANARAEIGNLERYLTPWSVFNDPPTHTRLRAVMNRGFSLRFAAMRPRIEELVDRLLTRLQNRTDADIIADFAYPFPASVIMVMLGVPLDEIDAVREWSDELAIFVGSGLLSADKARRADAGIAALSDYFQRMIDKRRQESTEDMLSDLMQPGDNGERLTEDELIAAAILVLFAGHETTTNLIGNGLLELINHPDQLVLLRSQPALAETAIEEVLRYQGPSGAMTRVMAETMTMHGATLNKGDRVFAMVNAANRDARRFSEPERFDLARDPNPSITFGAGIHFCLGAPLARLEGEIALPALLRRFSSFELVDDVPDWNDSLVLRGLRTLNVKLARPNA